MSVNISGTMDHNKVLTLTKRGNLISWHGFSLLFKKVDWVSMPPVLNLYDDHVKMVITRTASIFLAFLRVPNIFNWNGCIMLIKRSVASITIIQTGKNRPTSTKYPFM